MALGHRRVVHGSQWLTCNIHQHAVGISTDTPIRGVFKSTNGGGNWTSVNTGRTDQYIYAVAIDPTASQTVYAATRDGGVCRSTNGGNDWSGINTGLGYTWVRALAIDPTATQTVYAGVYGGGVFQLSPRASWDTDADGQSDISVWRPNSGIWYTLPSNSPGYFKSSQWGILTDKPVPGDYDGDGKSDVAVWRPETGTWYVLPSSAPDTYFSRQWGLPGDIPIPEDTDGDGKTDIAVWRPDSGVWYILPSSTPGNYIAALVARRF